MAAVGSKRVREGESTSRAPKRAKGAGTCLDELAECGMLGSFSRAARPTGHPDAVFGDLPAPDAKRGAPMQTDGSSDVKGSSAAVNRSDRAREAMVGPLFACGVAHKGQKSYQQDTCVVMTEFRAGAEASPKEPSRCAYFAVFDGLNGDYCTTYLRDTLHTTLARELATYLRKDDMTALEMMQRALLQAFLKTDRELLAQINAEKPPIPVDGACGTVALVRGARCWLASVGDTKAVLGRRHSRRLNEIRSIRLTTDHSPMVLSERKRIEGYFGYVDAEGRVMGQLAVSRAFGDYRTKKFGVIAQPSLSKFTICRLDEFLIIASDGLWNVISPEEAVAFVHRFLQREQSKRGKTTNPARADPKKADACPYDPSDAGMCRLDCDRACKALVEEAVVARAAKDNTTVVLVLFGGDGGVAMASSSDS